MEKWLFCFFSLELFGVFHWNARLGIGNSYACVIRLRWCRHSGKMSAHAPQICDSSENRLRMLHFNRQIHTCYHNIFFVEWDMWWRKFEGTFPESGNLIYFDLGLSTRNENKQWELYKCRHFAEWGCLQATSMRTHFAAVSVMSGIHLNSFFKYPSTWAFRNARKLLLTK